MFASAIALSGSLSGLDAAAQSASVEPDVLALQQSMRGFVGLSQTAAAVTSAFEEQNAGTGAIREGLVLTARETKKWDSYFASIARLEQSKDRLMAKHGDKFTWLHVNNNIEAPGVDVGVTPSASQTEKVAFLSELPKGWTVAERKAKNGHNKTKALFDQLSEQGDLGRAVKAAAGPHYLRSEWKPWEDKFTVIVKKDETNPKAAENKVKMVPGLEDSAIEYGEAPREAAGHLDSGGGAKAGTRIGTGSLLCTSNVTMRDVTNNRWVMLTAGHCLAGSPGPHNLIHGGQAIGTYRVGSAVNSIGPVAGVPGRMRDVAIYDLNAGQESGLMLWVGVPIDNNVQARGHGFTDYMKGWTNTTLGEMVCLEGASPSREVFPYVNAARGPLQTVCGAAGSASSDGLAVVNFWSGGWGEAGCSGDSGGLARIPSTQLAVGILSSTTVDRPLLAAPGAACGTSGFFMFIADAVRYYASVGITLQAVDGLSMVRNIKDPNGLCLGRPGGNHFAGFAITREGCNQEWRILPANEIVRRNNEPIGDDIYIIEHWGVCVQAVPGTQTVNQAGCNGYPFPQTTKWRFKLFGNGFTLESMSQQGQFLTAGPGNTVSLSTSATTWSFG